MAELAFAACKSGVPDLVITDMVMPERRAWKSS
jgi:YesN/AraC family two-component response regulator